MVKHKLRQARQIHNQAGRQAGRQARRWIARIGGRVEKQAFSEIKWPGRYTHMSSEKKDQTGKPTHTERHVVKERQTARKACRKTGKYWDRQAWRKAGISRFKNATKRHTHIQTWRKESNQLQTQVTKVFILHTISSHETFRVRVSYQPSEMTLTPLWLSNVERLWRDIWRCKTARKKVSFHPPVHMSMTVTSLSTPSNEWIILSW